VLYTDPDGRAVKIVIQRDTYTTDTVTSAITVTSDVKDAGSFDGFTLEDTKAGPNGDKDPIAAGTYDGFVRTDHDPNRIELKGVPGFSNVQIHVGNNKDDVMGCFAVGETRSADSVTSSKGAMKSILAIIETDGSDVITVTVEGPSTKPADKSTKKEKDK
jgi:hypothetical protein